MSWLESELHEQPAALARLIERQSGCAREIAQLRGLDIDHPAGLRKVTLTR